MTKLANTQITASKEMNSSSLNDTQRSMLRISARDVTRLTSDLDDDTLDDLFAAASLERQRRAVASYSGPMGSLANQQRGDQ
jgi:hypothetical protein